MGSADASHGASPGRVGESPRAEHSLERIIQHDKAQEQCVGEVHTCHMPLYVGFAPY